MVVRKVVSYPTQSLIQEHRLPIRPFFHLVHQSESHDLHMPHSGREEGMFTEELGHPCGWAPCYWTKEEEADGGLVCQSLSYSLRPRT